MFISFPNLNVDKRQTYILDHVPAHYLPYIPVWVALYWGSLTLWAHTLKVRVMKQFPSFHTGRPPCLTTVQTNLLSL